MASNDLNLCQFIGHLGKDVDTRFMPNGDAVAAFSLACNWKGKDTEGVEWVRVTAFGKLAEICSEYLRKGSQVYISGRMRTRKYRAKDGSERYATEIVAEKMQMFGGKPESAGGGYRPEAAKQLTRPAESPMPGGFDSMDDDIPF